MNVFNPKLTRKNYVTGIVSGMTWGMDTTLIAFALSISPFFGDMKMLLTGTFICCLIHIFFEAVTMSAYVSIRHKLHEIREAFSNRGTLILVLGAVFGGPIAMMCYLLALKTTGTDMAATVTDTYPLIGAILATLLLREKVSLQVWLGIMLCVFGIFYSGMFIEPDAGEANITGILLAFITALGWGLEGVACRYALHRCKLNPHIALWIREISCLAVYMCIAPLFIGNIEGATDAIMILINCWPALLLVVLASFLGAYSMLLWYRTILAMGATRGLCLNASYCVWTLVFTSILFTQLPSMNVWAGAAMTIFGIAMAIWPSTQRARVSVLG